MNFLTRTLDKLTIRRSLAIGILSVFIGLCVVTYHKHELMLQAIFPSIVPSELRDSEKELVAQFMIKYPEVSYATVLRFEFQRNTRIPIHRAFNDKDVEEIVIGRLQGGDGALPIFIEDDGPNNNAMIKIIQGEMICNPFKDGGLARVWPDLVKRFTISCRTVIPPGFGSGAHGYIVIHLDEPQSDYRHQTMRRDLNELAIGLDKTWTRAK